ncbi:hypothetical protein D9M73_73290 [compost metagenome]
MQAPTLLGPTGNQMLAIGGEYAWRQYVKGDVMITFQWINDDPSICLFPAVPRIKRGAYVIGLSALHKYVENTGHPTRYMVAQSIKIAQQLGFQPGKDICFRLVEMVLDAALELVHMPPTPEIVRKAEEPDKVGEMVVKQGGRVVMEREV